MLIHPKNKIIVGLLVVASTAILALGLLFYNLPDKGSITTKNIPEASSEFTNTNVDGTEEKEAPHFSIFSILNKLIPN